MPTFESAVDAALVCVLDADDPDVEPQIAGTAFAVGNGLLITCHHVVDARHRLLLRTADGTQRELDPADITVLPDVDLAVLRAGDLDLPALPVAADQAGAVERFWTKGFHRVGPNVRGPFPAEGSDVGRTNVSYATSTSEYSIDNVLVLRREVFGPGLSGAPVIDPDTGVVIGVVSTRLLEEEQAGGFGVPWTAALEHSEIADLLAESSRTVPAYGRFLNLAAVEDLCRRQLARSVEELTRDGRVDLNNRVERSGVSAALDQFLSDDAQILPLIGPSGAGKSTELAALAVTAGGTALLLKGSAITPSHRHLGEVVAAVLRDLPGDEPLPERPAEALSAALAREGRRLVVLLDGLNEAPFGRDLRPEQWMAASVTWLKEANAKLLFSCRPELWGLLVAQNKNLSPLALGEFSELETATAAVSYGLTLPSTHRHVLRLPLMLRLYAELTGSAGSDDTTATGVHGLMAAYAQDRCRAVAARADRYVSSDGVHERLLRAAAEMWAAGNDLLQVERVEAIFGRDEAEALVDEHVLALTRNGYRFVFDDAADWLKGIGLDPERELRPARLAKLSKPNGWRRTGALAYMLREVEWRDGSAGLASRLRVLLADAGKLEEVQQRYRVLELVKSTLRPVADPEAYLEVLNQLAAYELATPELARRTEFWKSVPLPLAARLSPLRTLVLDSNYFPWRGKDWHDEPVRQDSDYNYAALALELAGADLATAIPALREWLSDSRRLRDDDDDLGRGEATVGDVAAGIMYRHFAGHEALVLEQVAAAWPHEARLLTELVTHHTGAVIDWIVEHESRAPEGMISHTLDLVSVVEGSDPRHPILKELGRRVYERTRDPVIRAQTLGHIVAAADHENPSADDLAAADAVLHGFRDGAFWISDDTLARAVRLRPAEGYAAVRAALNDQRTSDNAVLALVTLANDYGQSEQTDTIVLEHFRGGRNTGGFRLGSYVEHRLVNAATPSTVLVELTREVMASGERGQLKSVAYGLASPRCLVDARSIRDSLLDELVAEVVRRADRNTCWSVVGVLVKLRDDAGLLDSRTWSILSSLKPDAAEHIAIAEAIGHGGFAEGVVGWLRTRTDRLGARGRRILELADTGLSPAEAVAKYIRESLD